MDEERLEQKLRDYFNAEIKKVEPSSEWWDNTISRVTKPTPRVSFWEQITRRASSRPIWRAALPVLVAIPAVIILIVLSVLQPWNSFSGPQAVMAKGYEATERLQTYRIYYESTQTTYKGETSKQTFESEFAAPDRYHIKSIADQPTEAILIDKRLFLKSGSVTKDAATVLLLSSPSFITRETALKTLGYLINIEKLPDEKLDGVDCFHYRGKVDIAKQFEGMNTNLSPAEMELLRQTENYIEVWIGKEDYLIRQSKQSYQLPAFLRNSQLPTAELGQMDNYTLLIKNYDFNQAITIEPPLTTTGDLLPGWEEIFNSSFSRPVFGKGYSISFTDDETNPGRKKINFRFFISNTRVEVASNVRVFVTTTMTTDDPTKPITIELEPSRQGPISLKQFEQETFTGSLEYYSSGASNPREETEKLQSTTRVIVKHMTPYGVEKVEQLYPDIPNSNKVTPPSPPGK